MAEVIQSLKSRRLLLPVLLGANRPSGTLLMKGPTGGTDLGTLIQATASSNAGAVGILAELHDYSASGDCLVDGTVDWFPNGTLASGKTQFPSRVVELIDTATLIRADYSLASGNSMTAVSSSGTTVTVSSLEDDIDTSFLYVGAGTGIGQLAFVATSTSGSCTTGTAFATVLDSTSKVVKVLRLFHDVVVWVIGTATVPTKLGTTAAAGTGRAVILSNHMVRNGLDERLNPNSHGALTSLNSLSQFGLYSVAHVVNTVFHPIA